MPNQTVSRNQWLLLIGLVDAQPSSTRVDGAGVDAPASGPTN